jgi:hypothetical protein
MFYLLAGWRMEPSPQLENMLALLLFSFSLIYQSRDLS